MKTLAANTLLVFLVLFGIGMTVLANTGGVGFGEPYIRSVLGQPEAGAVVAFRSVNVVPLDHEVVPEGQTVLGQDRRIIALGGAGEIATPYPPG